MGLKISASSLFQKHYLVVNAGGVKFFDNTSFFGSKRLLFSRIECVLMSPDHKLSFQYGNEVFTIQTRPENAKHQAVLQALLQGVQPAARAGILP